MRFLLDTHIWLWSVSDPGRLSRTVADALSKPAAESWLSPVSLWEVLLLCEKGRLRLDPDPFTWITAVLTTTPLREAPLSNEVALATSIVRLPHRDPADRFLAATAHAYDLTLVTGDEKILAGSGYRVLSNC
jgi:PIN domain nuclease of toxin-antitoxin system